MNRVISILVVLLSFVIGGGLGYTLSSKVTSDALGVFVEYENEEVERESVQAFYNDSLSFGVSAQLIFMSFIERRVMANWIDDVSASRMLGMAQARLAALYKLKGENDKANHYLDLAFSSLRDAEIGVRNKSDVLEVVSFLINQRMGEEPESGKWGGGESIQ